MCPKSEHVCYGKRLARPIPVIVGTLGVLGALYLPNMEYIVCNRLEGCGLDGNGVEDYLEWFREEMEVIGFSNKELLHSRFSERAPKLIPWAVRVFQIGIIWKQRLKKGRIKSIKIVEKFRTIIIDLVHMLGGYSTVSRLGSF